MHHSLSTGSLRVTWGISNTGSQLLEQVQAVRRRRALRQGHHSKLHIATAAFPPTALLCLSYTLQTACTFNVSLDHHCFQGGLLPWMYFWQKSQEMRLRTQGLPQGIRCILLVYLIISFTQQWEMQEKTPTKGLLRDVYKKTSQDHWSWEASL